jgi:hypothetical protein
MGPGASPWLGYAADLLEDLCEGTRSVEVVAIGGRKEVRKMSTPIVEAEVGYGFLLTRFAGPNRTTMYQIDVADKHVELSEWQMLQLVCSYALDHNKLAMERNSRQRFS